MCALYLLLNAATRAKVVPLTATNSVINHHFLIQNGSLK